MKRQHQHEGCPAPTGKPLTPEVTEFDERLFARLIDTTLDAAAEARIVTPAVVQPAQDSVLAVHWHPEHGLDDGVQLLGQTGYLDHDLA